MNSNVTTILPARHNLYWLLAILLLPLILSFGLPLLFYRLPIGLKLWDGPVQLSGGEILCATAVWVVWVGIAVLTPLVLSKRIPRVGPARPWSTRTSWRGFVILSLGGTAVSLAQYFVSFHSGIEQLLRQLSFAPTIATVVGIQVLKNLLSFDASRRSWLLFGIFLLLILNVGNAIVLPILLGRAAPAIYAGLAILFGIHVMRIGGRQLVVIWLLFFLLAGLSMTYRGNFRNSWLGSAFWHNGQYIRIPIGDVLRGKTQETYSQLTGRSTLEFGRSLNLMDDSASFSGHDVNYRNMRFLPDDRSSEKARYLIAKTLNRINHLGELAYVIRITPEVIPYMNGATYYPLLFKPIPRVLWKSKPEDNSGQVYGHRYGMLHPTDSITSVNMGVIIEAWINGGWAVVILSSLAFGTLLYLVWRFFIGESGGTGNILLATAFLSSAVGTESSMNLVMGGVLYTMLVWWVMEYLIRTRL